MITVSLCVKLILYCLAAAFLLCFCYYFSIRREELFLWNRKHAYIIWIVFAFGILYCFLYRYVPFYAMPFGILSVVFLLASGRYCGYVFYNAVLVFYALLFSPSVSEVSVLLLIGLIGSLLTYSVGKGFRYYGAAAAYLICDLILYCALIFDVGFSVSFRDFILYSAIRILSSGCVLLMLFKWMQYFVICRDENFFLRINDPEHELMMRLKVADEDAYYHAVHTAYFADKMAKLIGADAMLAQALGYYHRIGLLQGKDTIQNTLTVAASHHFPVSLQNAMREYGIRTAEHISKEAAIVQICDALVSSVTFLFRKDKNAELDYEKLTDVIIKKKFEGHDFENCVLTLHELYKIKKGFAEEKQYYDLLRG